MNYYIEMIKDFVRNEIEKPEGRLLDDGEFVYACGLIFQRVTKKDKKNVRLKKINIVLETSTISLLKVELLALLNDYDWKSEFSQPERNLVNMVKAYKPQGSNIDSTMLDVLKESFLASPMINKYERQEKYSKKVGLVSKTYKLNSQVVEDFANTCKNRGVSLGPTLTELMIQFIQQS